MLLNKLLCSREKPLARYGRLHQGNVISGA
jgi:hypothetical protein